MQKNRETNVQPFEFADLQSGHVISQEKFQPFSFKSLEGRSIKSEKASESEIRKERSYEAKNNFKIDEIVRDYRGLTSQEQSDLEKRIQDEVTRRLEIAHKDAYAQGLEEGRTQGQAESLSQFQEALAEKMENLAEVIKQIQSQTDRILEQNRHDIYEFVKRFTKWIILKEVNEKVYLESLLEKLILELNVRKNLIVKVGRDNFKDMPDIVKNVESRLGQLSNLRIEIVPELNQPGIILESENGLIDGSLEGVFANIDKIFEQVVGHE